MSFTKVTNTGIGSTGTVLLQNLDVTGIVTAGFGVSTVDVFTTGITSFANTTDSTSSTTGSVIVSGGVGIAGSLNVGGSVSVGGTLTYEDVTNVDSVGLITARNGIEVTDKGVQVGTGATVDSPANNALSFLTNGSERARINSNGKLLINHSSARGIGGSQYRQIEIEGTDAGDSGLSIARNSANASPPSLNLGKSRASSVGGTTIVQDDDALGSITFAGADGTNLQTNAAEIRGEVDGTPGENDMPGRLVFKTTADGSASTTERARITSTGNFGIGTVNVGARLVVLGNSSSLTGQFLQGADTVAERTIFAQSTNGNNFGAFVDGSNVRHLVSGTNDILTSEANYVALHTNSGTERLRITSAGELLINQSTANTYVDGAGYSQTPKLQVISNTNSDTAISLRYNSGAGATGRRASFIFARTADGTAVLDDSVLGEVLFMGEGNSTLEKAASVRAEVDGTPGTNDMPGRLVFSTTADGSDSLTERLRITKNGDVLIGGTNEITDTQVAINGNIAQYNSGTGTGAAIKTFALAKTYSMSTSATNILTFDNWGTSAFDITVFRKDTAAPAGAQVVKVYLAFHGSGTNITQATLAQENKVLRGSIHNIDYSISENNNTATLIATGDNNGGETQTLVFHILAHGNTGGEITVV